MGTHSPPPSFRLRNANRRALRASDASASDVAIPGDNSKVLEAQCRSQRVLRDDGRGGRCNAPEEVELGARRSDGGCRVRPEEALKHRSALEVCAEASNSDWVRSNTIHGIQ